MNERLEIARAAREQGEIPADRTNERAITHVPHPETEDAAGTTRGPAGQPAPACRVPRTGAWRRERSPCVSHIAAHAWPLRSFGLRDGPRRRQPGVLEP